MHIVIRLMANEIIPASLHKFSRNQGKFSVFKKMGSLFKGRDLFILFISKQMLIRQVKGCFNIL